MGEVASRPRSVVIWIGFTVTAELGDADGDGDGDGDDDGEPVGLALGTGLGTGGV
jgi:hypothetical protein